MVIILSAFGKWRFKPARYILIICTLFMYLISTNYGARYLGNQVAFQDETTLTAGIPQAIIVLSGNLHMNHFNYVRYQKTLELHKAHPTLPLIFSGGGVHPSENKQLYQHVKEVETVFNMKFDYHESQSRNTYENAYFSWDYLQPKGIKHIFLVTDSFHLVRAKPIFEKMGFIVTPAYTPFTYLQETSRDWQDFIPHPMALTYSHYALSEIIGRFYYRHFK